MIATIGVLSLIGSALTLLVARWIATSAPVLPDPERDPRPYRAEVRWPSGGAVRVSAPTYAALKQEVGALLADEGTAYIDRTLPPSVHRTRRAS